MATLTGKLISNTYKDLLQVSNGNDGVDSTVRFVSDGEGTNSALQISQSAVNVAGGFTVNGVSVAVETDANRNISTGLRATINGVTVTDVSASATFFVAADQSFGLVSVSTGLHATSVNASHIVVVSASATDFTATHIIATSISATDLDLSGTLNYGGVLLTNAVTGTGKMVLDTSPTLVTPALGVATGTSFQGIIGNVTPAAGTFATLESTAVQPILVLEETDAAANNQVWDITALGEQLNFRALNDARNAATSFLTVDRTANTIDLLAFTGTAATFSGTLSATSFQGIIGNVTPAAGTFTTVTATALATLGEITLTTANPEILGGDTNGAMFISATSSPVTGGTVVIYGDTHATKASDWELRSGNIPRFSYDASITTLVAANKISVDDTTDSTSGTTGSIHTDGGLGVAKDVFIGDQLIISSDQGADNSSGTVYQLSLRSAATPTKNVGMGYDNTNDHGYLLSIDRGVLWKPMEYYASIHRLYTNNQTLALTLDASANATFAGAVVLSNAAGPTLLNEAATATNPTLIPNRADPDTGIGWDFANNMDIIAGGTRLLNTDTAGLYMRVNGSVGVPCIRMNDANSGIYIPGAGQIGFSTDGVAALILDASANATFAGAISVDNTTDSTSGTTGSIHTDGGLGVAKSVYIGANAFFESNQIFASTHLYIQSGVGENIILRTNNGTTALTLDSSQNATFAGAISVDDTTDSTSGTTGSIQTDGGLGVQKSINVAGDIKVDAGTANTAVDITPGVITISSAYPELRFKDATGDAYDCRIYQSSTNNSIVFDTGGNGAAAEALKLDSSQNATFAGNLVIGTSGKGIDFSATADGSGTTTSELLDDYEEGTWTPTDVSGATLSLTTSDNTYTKIGRVVHCSFYISMPSTADGTTIAIGSLPFTNSGSGVTQHGGTITYTNYSTERFYPLVTSGAATFNLGEPTGGFLINSDLSLKQFRGVLTYIAA